MLQNIEIKARLEDFEGTYSLVQRVTNEEPVLLNQTDTYFNCEKGRLKLREINNTQSELIFYQRPDTLEPKSSNYIITPNPNPSFKELLTQAYGLRGVVKKKRHLFMTGQTRIHLDQVTELGDFIELEVVLRVGQSIEEGQAIAEQLMIDLKVDKSKLMKGSYIDFH